MGWLHCRGLCLALVMIGSAATLARGETVHVDTIDVPQLLGPKKPIPAGVESILRYGTLVVCARGSDFDMRAVVGRAPAGTGCRIYPLIYRHDEGTFPQADTLIGDTPYRAQKIHLLRRPGRWFLFLEGHPDSAVSAEHRAVVLELRRFAPPKATCSGQIEASDESDFALNQCIDAFQKPPEFGRWPDRYELNPVAVRDGLDLLARGKPELLPDFFRNDDLKLGGQSHRTHDTLID